jgi:hypothetical protein
METAREFIETARNYNSELSNAIINKGEFDGFVYDGEFAHLACIENEDGDFYDIALALDIVVDHGEPSVVIRRFWDGDCELLDYFSTSSHYDESWTPFVYKGNDALPDILSWCEETIQRKQRKEKIKLIK